MSPATASPSRRADASLRKAKNAERRERTTLSQEVLKAGDEAKRAAAAAAAVTQAGLTETEYRAWQQDMEARLAQLRLVCQMRGLGLSRRPRAGFSQERSGQFWTMAGDEALMCLETFWRNRRWHDLFPHSKPPSLANN